MLTQFVLPNGINVAAYKVPSSRSVNINLVVKGGANFDRPGKMGTAHLMEHMLMQGTPSLPSAAKLAEFVESRAGYINAYTYFESVEFVLRLPNKYLEEMLKLSAEVFFQSLFPLEALEKEKAVMLEEINANFMSTHDKIGRFFLDAKYAPGSVLKNEVVGMPNDVKGLTMADLKLCYEEIFKTDNTFLCVVGNFEEEQLRVLVEKYFSPIRTDAPFAGTKYFSDADLNPVDYHFREDKDLSSVYVDLSYKALPKDAPVKDWLAQLMAMNVLANLHHSRLYDVLRYQRGLIYSISMNSVALPGFGINNIPFECSPENTAEVLDLVVNALIKIKEEGISEEEFSYIQNYSVDSSLMQFDSMGAIMDTLKQDMMWEDKIYLPEDTAAMLKNISREDVNKIIREKWDFSKANLAIQMASSMSEQDERKCRALLAELKKR